MGNRSIAARRNAEGRGSRRPAMNVVAALSAAHWVMQPDLLRAMISIALRENPTLEAIEIMRADRLEKRRINPEAIEADAGQYLENSYNVRIRDGVATIPVHGPMCRYMDYFSYVSGGTTYEQIASDYLTCEKDPDVRSILWDFDTGGGEVHGCQSLARLIYQNRGTKPQVAFGAGDVCSAGMWLASAVGRTVVAPTSVLGCLGVYTCVTDFSLWEKSQGIETIEFRSSQTPAKNRDPKTAEGSDDIQQVLDALCEVFLDDMSLFRDVPIETVLSDFGQGGVFVGEAAKTAGLADDIGYFDDVHAELVDRASGTTSIVIDGSASRGAGSARRTSSESRSESTSSSTDTERTMNDKNPKASTTPKNGKLAASAEQPDPAVETTTDPDAPEEDQEKKKDKQDEEESTDPTAKAVKAERERVLGIQALQRHEGESAIVAACVSDPKCTVADAALKLRQAEGASASGAKYLKNVAGDEAAALPPKNAAAPSSEKPTVDSLAESILSAGRSGVSINPREQR